MLLQFVQYHRWKAAKEKRNLTSHLISCGFHRCVWFEQCAGTWRVKNALPFYEPFEVVPSEVLRTLAGRSLFMAIRCTRQGWKTYIKKIKKNSSDSPSYRRLSRTLTPFTRDCQRFIGNFNIIVKKKLRVQKNDSNENKMIFFRSFRSLEHHRVEKTVYLMIKCAWWVTREFVCRFLLCVNHVRIDCGTKAERFNFNLFAAKHNKLSIEKHKNSRRLPTQEKNARKNCRRLRRRKNAKYRFNATSAASFTWLTEI